VRLTWARERQPALAIQAQVGAQTDEGRRQPGRRDVPHHAARVRVSGDDLEHVAVLQPDPSLIGRLAAAAGIEARAVAGQGVTAHRHDDGVGPKAVIVVEVQPVGGLHDASSYYRPYGVAAGRPLC